MAFEVEGEGGGSEKRQKNEPDKAHGQVRFLDLISLVTLTAKPQTKQLGHSLPLFQ